MPSVPVLDIYGYISDVFLQITPLGQRAVIDYVREGKTLELLLEQPRPLSALLSVFDQSFYGIRIYDRNVEETNQLEFGRYRVEFWDEDNPLAECIADAFVHGTCGETRSD